MSYSEWMKEFKGARSTRKHVAPMTPISPAQAETVVTVALAEIAAEPITSTPEPVTRPARKVTLFNDNYVGRRWAYGGNYRPLCYANIPDGWIIESNRTHPDFKSFGTIDYPEELTAAQIYSYELTPIPGQQGITLAAILAPAQAHTEIIKTSSMIITLVSPNPIAVTQILEPEPARELSPAERGEVFSVPLLAMIDYIKLYPEAGIPAKKDVFHIETLTTPVFGGMSLPIENKPENFPVFVIANQHGHMMQTVTSNKITLAEHKDNPLKLLGWYYRGAGHNSAEVAQQLAIKDLKALKSWQRAYYSAKPAPAEYINLNARGTVSDGFTVTTAALLQAVKVYGKKTMLNIAGFLFPASTLADICKVASGDVMTITVKADYGNETSSKDKNNKPVIVETPALIIRHGSARTTILGKVTDDWYKNNFQIIPVNI